MQVTVTGTYKDGQVFLDEIPPIADESQEVMVVFLSKSSAPSIESTDVKRAEINQTDSHQHDTKQNDKSAVLEKEGLLKMQELGGVLSGYCEGMLSDDTVIEQSNEHRKDKLAGMFSSYVTQRVSDEEVEEAITQSIYERAMAGKL